MQVPRAVCRRRRGAPPGPCHPRYKGVTRWELGTLPARAPTSSERRKKMQGFRYRYAVLIMLLGLVAGLTAAVPAFAASDCPSGQTQFKIDSRPGNGTY